MARNITVGIDVGTRSIRVVVSEYVKGQQLPIVIGSSVVVARGLKHGYIIDEREAAKSIFAAVRGAEKSSRVKIKSAFLSIGGVSLESMVSRGSIVITRANEEVTELDMERAISASKDGIKSITNKKIIDIVPLGWKLDGKKILGKPQGLKGSRLEVQTLFIVSLAQHIDDLVRATEATGVEVEDIVAAPIAASLVALTKRQRTVGCLLVNIGAETVSMSVFEEDTPISLYVFPIGSSDITNDIALGLQVPLEEAEQIKLSYTNPHGYSQKQLSEIIEARLSDIFELIEAHLKKIKRNRLLPGGIVITGGGAGISTLEDFAKATLKLPTKIATPEFLVTDREGHIQDSSWFVAYGLCIFGFNQNRKPRQSEFIRTAKNLITSWIRQILP